MPKSSIIRSSSYIVARSSLFSVKLIDPNSGQELNQDSVKRLSALNRQHVLYVGHNYTFTVFYNLVHAPSHLGG